MTWYKTGTVSVTNGQATVTGTGTNFSGNIAAGEMFIGPDGALYEIEAIPSATQLTLSKPYAGTTNPTGQYVVVPVRGYVRDLARRAGTILDSYQAVSSTATQAAQAAAASATEAALIAESLGGAPVVPPSITGTTYDGQNRVTAYAISGVQYTVSYPSSTSIVVNGGGKVQTITLDQSGRFVGSSIAA